MSLRLHAPGCVGAITLLVSGLALAHANGISGYSGREGRTCAQCHGSAEAVVELFGPRALARGQQTDYVLVVSRAGAVDGGAGAGIAVGAGASVTSLDAAQLGAVTSTELTHLKPRALEGGRAGFTFRVGAPPSPSTSSVPLYVSAAAVDLAGSEAGDAVGAKTLGVPLLPGPEPVLVQGVTPIFTPGGDPTSVQLSAEATSASGPLSYRWLAIGPGVVTFEPNDSPAASRTTAYLTAAGRYTVLLVAEDAGGLGVVGRTVIEMQPIPVRLVVEPATLRVTGSAVVDFSAVAFDQFDQPLSEAIAPWWSVSGGGYITPAGRFVASSGASGQHTVTAAIGGAEGFALIEVIGDTEGDRVRIEPPAGGKLVYGLVPLTVWVDESIDLEELILFVDGLEAGAARQTPAEFSLDTTGLREAEHVVQAMARAKDGTTASSERLSLIVANTRQADSLRGEFSCAQGAGLPSALGVLLWIACNLRRARVKRD